MTLRQKLPDTRHWKFTPALDMIILKVIIPSRHSTLWFSSRHPKLWNIWPRHSTLTPPFKGPISFWDKLIENHDFESSGVSLLFWAKSTQGCPSFSSFTLMIISIIPLWLPPPPLTIVITIFPRSTRGTICDVIVNHLCNAHDHQLYLKFLEPYCCF